VSTCRIWAANLARKRARSGSGSTIGNLKKELTAELIFDQILRYAPRQQLAGSETYFSLDEW
jgi:hypothetical protein